MESRAPVLVVSGDRGLREQLRSSVLSLGALPVLTGDPDVAVEIAVDTQPGAAILDGELVRTDARVRPASLRRVSSLATAPIVIVASRARSGGLVLLDGGGPVGVVERSLESAAMAARLRAWLEVPSSKDVRDPAWGKLRA